MRHERDQDQEADRHHHPWRPRAHPEASPDAFTTAASQAARDAAARADEKHGELVRALFCGVAENITALKTDCLDAHFGPEPPYPMTPAVTVSAAAVVVDTDQADAEAERQRLMDQAECKW